MMAGRAACSRVWRSRRPESVSACRGGEVRPFMIDGMKEFIVFAAVVVVVAAVAGVVVMVVVVVGADIIAESGADCGC